jgi:GntR family transcriptional regulator/MocR family aminotransferase
MTDLLNRSYECDVRKRPESDCFLQAAGLMPDTNGKSNGRKSDRGSNGFSALPTFTLDRRRGNGEPIYRQVYRGLRHAIETGQLSDGDRLTSSRGLAQELGVSRTSVLLALQNLRADGLIVGKIGSGTRIAPAAETILHLPSRAGPRFVEGSDSINAGPGPEAFRLGLPALDLFPTEAWGRLAARRWRESAASCLDYSNPSGYPPFRKVIAEYLWRTRAIRCPDEQILVTAGAQHGIDLIARCMVQPGDRLLMEEPGYFGARLAFQAAGATIVPAPLAADGLDLEQGLQLDPDPQFVYVTPSHQFPTMVSLSTPRRESLLRWARRTGAWIIEDDYDNELCCRERIPAMAGMPGQDRVFYVGTFSKTVFPALRLGYLVVPRHLVERFRAVRHSSDRQSSLFHQLVMEDFIRSGQYDRHLRRMRRVYDGRRQAVISALNAELSDLVHVSWSHCGIHCVAWLKAPVSDQAASIAAADQGIEALPISFFSHEARSRGALILGFGGVHEDEALGAVRRLRRALATVLEQTG